MERVKRVYTIREGRKPGRKPGERPDLWVTGPDPIVHKYFRVYIQARNQALFRNEGYELSFEQWIELWGNNIERRGRKSGDYYMTRIDRDKSWSLGNVEVLSRENHGRKS